MRGVFFSLFVLMAVACTPPKDASSSVQPSAADPLEGAWAVAPNAAEWLMNPKHTLRGVGAEQAIALLGELNAAGYVEIRAGDIQPDSQDASFKSAGTLLLELPRSRTQVLEFGKQRNLPIPAETDKYLQVGTDQLTAGTPGQ